MLVRPAFAIDHTRATPSAGDWASTGTLPASRRVHRAVPERPNKFNLVKSSASRYLHRVPTVSNGTGDILMAHANSTIQTRRPIGATMRRDAWWLTPVLVFTG